MTERKKPAIYKFYDYAKGVTDIVDQRMEFYIWKQKAELDFHSVCVCFGRLRSKCSNSVNFVSQTIAKKIEYLQLHQDASEIAK